MRLRILVALLLFERIGRRVEHRDSLSRLASFGEALELIAAAVDARALRAVEPGQISAECIPIQIGKSRELIQEGQINRVGRAVALLGDYQLGDVLVLIA